MSSLNEPISCLMDLQVKLTLHKKAAIDNTANKGYAFVRTLK